METRARPTSRGRARCVSFRMGRWWEQTAAGPRAGACRLRRRALGDAALPRWGKGRCKCARSTLFALRAKALQSGAPDFGRVAGESNLRGGLPIREISRRAGERGTGRWASPRRGWRYTPSRGRNAPCLQATPSASSSCSERGTSQGTPHPPLLHPPDLPAGRPAGSARTRSRDQSLENPFLGNRPSPNAAGGRPLLVGLPPSTRSTAPTGTKRSTPAPCSWGGRASTRSRRLLAAGTAGQCG